MAARHPVASNPHYGGGRAQTPAEVDLHVVRGGSVMVTRDPLMFRDRADALPVDGAYLRAPSLCHGESGVRRTLRGHLVGHSHSPVPVF